MLQNTATLGLSAQQVGEAASSYVVGAVCGALVFGWLTDRFGRRFVFYVTLMVYLAGVMLTALSWNFWSFAVFRAVTGLGIGGEYAAINSAIDELIPAKFRGRVDLIVNGSFWLGAALGSGASLLFLDPKLFSVDFGWRFGFAAGGVLGLGILLLRRLRAGKSALARHPRPGARRPTRPSPTSSARAVRHGRRSGARA